MPSKFGLKLRMVLAGSILFALYAAAGGLAFLVWGQGILPLVLVGSIGLIYFQYRFGRWAAIRSVGAEDMPDEGQYGDIHRTVEQLSNDMGIKKPTLKVASMGMPNAFAVGRKGDATVVVSKEIIQLLDRDELKGVLAHELAHVKNRDVVIMVLGQGVASVVGIVVQWAIMLSGDSDIGDFILGMIVGNIAQLLVMIFVFAISRYREYVADATAADYTNNPGAMASALEKISQGAKARASSSSTSDTSRGRGRGRRSGRSRRDEGMPEQVSALCIYGVDGSLLKKIFSTHPPVEKRIQRLRA